MLDKLITRYLKKYNLDKYVYNVTLGGVTNTYYLTLRNKEGKDLTIGFEIVEEYKEEVEFLLELLP